MSRSLQFRQLIPLGTVGWMPNGLRQTTCYLLTAESELVFLDAGTGIARLLDPRLRSLVADAKVIHILLSHFHLDHIIGVSYLPMFFRGKKVHVYGPGPEISGQRTQDVIEGLLRSPVFSLPVANFPMELSFVDLSPGRNRTAGFFDVELSTQQHSDPSVGMRLNEGQVAFVTDTPCLETTVSLAAQAGTLIHEAYFDNADFERLQSDPDQQLTLRAHSHARGVAELARRAEARRLVLTHFNPEYGERRLRKMERDCRKIFSATKVPVEGREIVL